MSPLTKIICYHHDHRRNQKLSAPSGDPDRTLSSALSREFILHPFSIDTIQCFFSKLQKYLDLSFLAFLSPSNKLIHRHIFPLTVAPRQTLFRSPDVVLTRAAGLNTFNIRYKLHCLSLWLLLLNLGAVGLTSRLLYHFKLVSPVVGRRVLFERKTRRSKSTA